MTGLNLRLPSPLTEARDGRLDANGIRLYLKRDDLIHSEFPGNKWRKLKYNLAAATKAGHSKLLTFGGAYSNHVRAVAAAGKHFGFSTVGVIRGEEHRPLNRTLEYAIDCGMTLTYMDRETYRHKDESDVIGRLADEFGPFYLIPEGGSNALALPGCAELIEEITVDFDVICCACGTGGTLAGIASALRGDQRAIGFAVLKGAEFLVDNVRELQEKAFGHDSDNWSIELDYHFGGYAKTRPELKTFIADCERRFGLQLDWIYEAKMMYGLMDLVDRGHFKTGTSIVALIAG
ncbi:1-aminocyclopropane-1-carboxylate deaminase/D-cysteine desulfhydrase [Amycolatopsis sp. EV170708-02-1]|uniref:1-aminocyclopropane-1-carboxylate deaminase/D-cysteine desulfhydrase n=1 Tax=Amycolatopsis sp. EV170708-02-1 TaxID=2919322 RepID=UPI001F0C8374|nr:pyridoxal-phosphate dependent enzyme [Amycolatopsis sp. EV170708-02-1]UMP04214.1 pyridoxal-phosphate dependent enzyme [Amycolatopsis sp. EV170708-02-1]